MGKQSIGKRKPKFAKRSKPTKPKSRGNYVDTFAKRMLGRIMVFVDFLFHYADLEFVAEIDLKRIKPAPTHYLGKDGKERILDLVFHCPLKVGGGCAAYHTSKYEVVVKNRVTSDSICL